MVCSISSQLCSSASRLEKRSVMSYSAFTVLPSLVRMSKVSLRPFCEPGTRPKVLKIPHITGVPASCVLRLLHAVSLRDQVAAVHPGEERLRSRHILQPLDLDLEVPGLHDSGGFRLYHMDPVVVGHRLKLQLRHRQVVGFVDHYLSRGL